MKNNNYNPRPSFGEWFAVIFWAIVAIAIIGGIIKKCTNL